MQNNLLKVYIGEVIPDLEYLEILNPNLGLKKRKNIFGDVDIFDNFTEKIVEVVDDPVQADFLLIPHNYFRIKNNRKYFDHFINLNKKVFVFAIGDSTEHIHIPNSIILRMSQYKTELHSNEIVIPAYAADLSYGQTVEYRKKQSMPVIGFCGWGRPTSPFSFFIKNNFILHGPRKQGLYFRNKILELLQKSSRIKTNFIIRGSFSASPGTIELDPKVARLEYRNNIIQSDFILAPRGDGNFSVRFYEALSLGRVPILIDTDCPLPLENKIDYSEFILRISYKDIHKIDAIVTNFYSAISDADWIKMQVQAREIFEKELRIDVFLRKLFMNNFIL